MESQLAKSTSGFLVGDRVTIADISAWGWVASHGKVFSFHSSYY
jgi:glutathione S-transferase